jgi:hypothetical protein
MRLSDSWRSEDQRADVTLDEMQRSELSQALGIKLGLEGHLEFLECLVVWQAGELQTGGVASALEHPDLRLEHEVKELAVAELRALGTIDELIRGLGEPEQLQLPSVGRHALCDQLTHRAPPRNA